MPRLIIDIEIEHDDQPAQDWEPAEPLRKDQRRALFAAFNAVFGTQDCDKRHLFTRMILGKDVDAPTTWSEGGPWSSDKGLTADEGSRLLDVLDACERVMCD